MKYNGVHVLIQPSGVSDYWTKRLLDGIHSEVQKRKKQLSESYFSVCENSEPAAFSSHPVMLVGTAKKWLSASAEYVLSHGGIPIAVNACIPELPFEVSGVCFALEHSVRVCIDYLIQLGKIRPAIIGLNPSSEADRRKSAVFCDYAEKKGVFGLSKFCEDAGLEESIASSVDEALAANADSFLCANDTAAILVISCLKKHRLAVGAEFPVIGMGNSFLGMNAKPSLTTVNFDYFSLGREAARLYDYLSENDNHPQAQIHIPTEIIIRESTGAVPYNSNATTTAELSNPLPDYFGGAVVSRLIMLENDLQQCDAIDREIIFGTAHKETYSRLSERLYLSERTLKYRLSHILKRLGLHNKSELSALVQEVLEDNDTI